MIRVHLKKRGRFWHMHYTAGPGDYRRESTGKTNREAAQTVADDKFMEINGLGPPKAKGPPALPWTAFRTEVENAVRASTSPANYARSKHVLDLFEQACRPRDARRIDRAVVHRFRLWLLDDDREPTLSVFTVKSYLGQLRACFGEAVNLGLLDANPAEKFKRIKLPRPIKVVLSGEEETKLRAACEDTLLACFVSFLLDTGMRRTEALKVRWQDLALSRDRARRTVIVRAPKTGEERIVTYSDRTLDLLLALQREHTGDYVFCPGGYCRGWGDTLLRRLKAACRRVGVREVTLQNLRQTCDTRLRRVLPRAEYERYMGHSDQVGREYYFDPDTVDPLPALHRHWAGNIAHSLHTRQPSPAPGKEPLDASTGDDVPYEERRSGGMADTMDSKSIGRKAVWVRLPPSAPPSTAARRRRAWRGC